MHNVFGGAGGAKLVFLKVVLVKKGVSKKNVQFFFGGGGSLGFTWLLLHDVTRCFRGVCKKPYKNRLFLSTLLLDAEETEKQQEEKNPKKSNTHFLGGLRKRAGSSSTFFAPKKRVFFKILKNPIFIVFPEKWVATIFFKKAMLQGGQI